MGKQLGFGFAYEDAPTPHECGWRCDYSRGGAQHWTHEPSRTVLELRGSVLNRELQARVNGAQWFRVADFREAMDRARVVLARRGRR